MVEHIGTTSAFGGAVRRRGLEDDQRGFAGVLARAGAAGATREAQAREAAEGLVAAAFVGPILKRMRESSSAAPPFAPNQAEKAFRGMLDATLAGKIVKSARWGLVDRVAKKVLREEGVGVAAAAQSQSLSQSRGAEEKVKNEK